jgi:glycosyltransferase involved in cell wall biosynthesis
VRVVFVGAHLAKGGGQALQVLELFRALRGSIDGTLLCLDAPGIHRVTAADPEIRVVGKLRMPGGVVELARSLRSLRGTYDLVQVFDYFYGLPASYLARAHPRVVRIGADPMLDVAARYGSGAALAMRMAMRVCLQDTQLVVNSPPLAELFHRYRPVVIPNGANLRRFDRLPTPDLAREELHLPPDAPLAVFVGKVIPVKRVEWVLEAVRQIPTLHGVIVGGQHEEHYGDRYYRHLVSSYADLRGRTSYCGEVRATEVTTYLASADVFVLPSRAEGMPNALIEAMAAGLPSVVSDIPAHRELIEDGVNGFLAPDVRRFTEAIRRLLDDRELRRRVGSRAARFVREHLTIQRSAERYLELYRRIVDAGREGLSPNSVARSRG